MKNKVLYWSPRILSILFVLFLFLFSFDGFVDFNGWKAILSVAVHLIIPIIVLLGTVVAWKKDFVGVVVFCFFAVYYVYMVGLNRHFSWYASISGPALLIGILYLLNGLNRRGSIRTRLSEDLTKAMKAQDTMAIKSLRILMSAIDNAGAVPVETPKVMPMSGKIAGATSGLYSTEVPRRELTDIEVKQIIKNEILEITRILELVDDRARPEVKQLEGQIKILKKYL